MTEPLDPIIEVHLGRDDLHQALRADARKGLTAVPKDIPPKWFYDERGSELFDRITRLEEYYPTEAEREVLLSKAEPEATVSRQPVRPQGHGFAFGPWSTTRTG